MRISGNPSYILIILSTKLSPTETLIAPDMGSTFKQQCSILCNNDYVMKSISATKFQQNTII